MTLLIWLLVGLALGVGVERIVGRSAAGVPRDEPARGALPRRRGARRILLWGSLVALLLLVAGLVGGYLWANSVFNRIERVEVSQHLTSGSGTNYLLVGSDNFLSGDQTREGVEGTRSDTIMVLRIEGGAAKMLSLNRDLWVTNPATGSEGRLNAAYNSGPGNLVAAVTDNFGVPIERYVEVDFASFASLVDSFGGIEIHFENPAIDRGSGLVVEEAGAVELDGEQALAYVRSRSYTEVIDGREVPQGGLPDVNRTMRQQEFLRAIMAKASDRRNPLTMLRAADQMAAGLRIDDDMTLVDAVRFAWSMGRIDPETVILPVVPRTTSGGAQVLEMGDGAEEVLAQFR